jgi:hypothetical protein
MAAGRGAARLAQPGPPRARARLRLRSRLPHGPCAPPEGQRFWAYRAFHKIVMGMAYLAGTAIAWAQVVPLFHAAARPEAGGTALFVLNMRVRRR